MFSPSGQVSMSACVAALIPDATTVPGLPAETPLRISQTAVVTPCTDIAFTEKTPVTIQPFVGTMKSSYIRENCWTPVYQFAQPGMPCWQLPFHQPTRVDGVGDVPMVALEPPAI